MVLEPSQPIQIVVGNRLVPSRVIRIMRSELYIDALNDTEIELTPLPGQKIWLRWVEDEMLLQQDASVLDVLDPVPIILVKLEGSPTVVESRKSFRVKISLPIEYRFVRPGAQAFITTTQDISSNGLRFPSAIKLWVGINLRIRVRVENRDIELIGKVVRVTGKPQSVRGRDSWETAVQFSTVAVADRRYLEEYVRRQHTRMRMRSGSDHLSNTVGDVAVADVHRSTRQGPAGEND